MKIFKFGGTSVGSPTGLENIKRIVSEEKGRIIVVVSAFSGITDQLLNTAQIAACGDKQGYQQELESMKQRHYDMVTDGVAEAKRSQVRAGLDIMFDELTNILKGVSLIQDLSPKTLDTIVSYGERLSSLIVHNILEGSKFIDARDFIKTTPYFNRHIVDFDLTNKLIHDTFDANGKVTVLGGFIASDKNSGETTNLGRGGSDYTAAIIAAALDAEKLEIYTDVDGFMSADPKIINNAYLIESLTFVEAMELCNFGAKVIYPPTIFPVYHKNIPISIKNTFNPNSPGTLISRENTVSDTSKVIKGISSINDTCLITIRGLGMVGVIGVNYRIFKAMAKSGISVFMVSQASSENTTSIGVKTEDADKAASTLSAEFAKEISMGEIDEIIVEKGLATIAIVGENMRRTPGIAGKLFGTLGRNGINVIATAQGASETNISFVVDLANLRKAINVIHDSFFLSEYLVLNLFVTGIGTVGRSLLEQIEQQQNLLLKQNSLKINIVGISNSTKSLFNREGIDLSNYKEQLLKEGIETNPAKIRDEIIKMNIYNPVFVDCTASADVAAIYGSLLEHSISVVTANKIAASSNYEHYIKLKNTARKRGIKFLFETNVGAGLPIIKTINDLRNSGDNILELQAVLSGTLNYIFNVLSEDIPFSKAVQMAGEAGYAEPDPRIDLSGTDVIRKLVILARESGYKVEQEDVIKNLFVPDEIFKGSVDDFWKNVTKLDGKFEEDRKKLAASGKKLRFVASMSEGRCEVGLQEVEAGHPFYNLEGSNNIILMTTTRYKEYPLQIKGYGAGAGVTAAGVFSDIMSIANIR